MIQIERDLMRNERLRNAVLEAYEKISQFEHDYTVQMIQGYMPMCEISAPTIVALFDPPSAKITLKRSEWTESQILQVIKMANTYKLKVLVMTGADPRLEIYVPYEEASQE